MALSGRSLVAAMCLAQVGNLLPHVVVPAVMAQHLMPLWASERRRGRADGQRLRVRLHAGGCRFSPRSPTASMRGSSCWWARRRAGWPPSPSASSPTGCCRPAVIWALAGIGFAGAYMPGLKGADRSAGARRRLAQRHLVHGELLPRRRPLLPRVAADSGAPGLALRLPSHRARAARDDRRRLAPRSRYNRRRARPGCSISARCCAIAPPSATSSATARIASSSTASAPGSSPSGGSLPPARRLGRARADHGELPRCHPRHAVEHPRQRGRDPLGPAPRHRPGDAGLRRWSPWPSACSPTPRRRCCWRSCCSMRSPSRRTSGALTSGMSASAEPAFRGATLALHSTVGFGLSALGGWAVGVALDAGGGPSSPTGWLAGSGDGRRRAPRGRWRYGGRAERGTLPRALSLPLRTNIASGFCNFHYRHKFTGCYSRSRAILWKCDLRKRSLPGRILISPPNTGARDQMRGINAHHDTFQDCRCHSCGRHPADRRFGVVRPARAEGQRPDLSAHRRWQGPHCQCCAATGLCGRGVPRGDNDRQGALEPGARPQAPEETSRRFRRASCVLEQAGAATRPAQSASEIVVRAGKVFLGDRGDLLPSCHREGEHRSHQRRLSANGRSLSRASDRDRRGRQARKAEQLELGSFGRRTRAHDSGDHCRPDRSRRRLCRHVHPRSHLLDRRADRAHARRHAAACRRQSRDARAEPRSQGRNR